MIPLAHYAGSQLVLAMTLHDQLGPTGTPIPAMPCVEGPAPLDLARSLPTAAEVEEDVCTSVFFDGARAVRSGFDVGKGIPHLTVPPNVMAVVHTLLSSHEAPYTVHGVQLQGEPAGTWFGCVLGIPCSDPVPVPLGYLVPIRGTVLAGLTGRDVLHCFASLAQRILEAMAWNRLTGGRWLGDGLFGEALPAPAGEAALAGLGKLGASEHLKRCDAWFAPFERLGLAPAVVRHVVGDVVDAVVDEAVGGQWDRAQAAVVEGLADALVDPEPRPAVDHRYHP